MERENNNPEFHQRRSVAIILDIIQETGDKGIALTDVTNNLDRIRIEQAKQGLNGEPDVPDVEEVQAVIDELLQTKRVVLRESRLYSTEHKN